MFWKTKLNKNTPEDLMGLGDKEPLEMLCGWCQGNVFFKHVLIATDTTNSWVECERCGCRTGIFESEYPCPYAIDMWEKFQDIFLSSNKHWRPSG